MAFTIAGLTAKPFQSQDDSQYQRESPAVEKLSSEAANRFSTSAIFKERFHTIERVFGWEDKFRRLLLRFDRLSQLHYAFKTLAYTMINLRHFCQG